MSIFGTERIPRTFLVGVAIILAGAAAAAWWLLRERQVVVFDRLEAQQLDSVSAELDRAGLAYEVDREAGRILVSPDKVQRARLAVMSSGNAFHEATGFELFDRSDFGMTDFAQRINYQRAIEGELSRTLSALAEIKFARVHLVLPENGLFRRQQRSARAAVTVFAEQGAVLMPEHIAGVQRIVAAAVPELSESDVTVTDESGRVLSTSAGDATEAQAGGRLAQKQAVERYLGDKVRRVLSRALGAERFAVSVDAELDFSRKTKRTERVLDAGAGSGIQRIKETSRGGDAAGADDQQKEVEYRLGHEVEEVDYGAGNIRRLQVGVIIDRDIPNVDPEQLRELVSAAIGMDTQRGDRVAVVQHGVVVQRAIEQVESTASAEAPGSEGDRTKNAASVDGTSSTEVLTPWSVALVLVIALAAAGLGVQRTLARRSEQRLQQVRHRLQAWVDAEQAEVRQS